MATAVSPALSAHFVEILGEKIYFPFLCNISVFRAYICDGLVSRRPGLSAFTKRSNQAVLPLPLHNSANACRTNLSLAGCLPIVLFTFFIAANGNFFASMFNINIVVVHIK
jgi:hypothetical protein